MAIFDWFRPKWRHSDPKVRMAAIAEIDDQSLLFRIAVEDADSKVRCTAVSFLRDQEDLLKFVMHRRSRGRERNAAIARLTDAKVLIGLAEKSDCDALLIATTADMAEEVRTAAAQKWLERSATTLSGLCWVDHAQLPMARYRLRNVGRISRESAAPSKDAALDLLIAQIDQQGMDRSITETVVEELGKAGTPKAVGALIDVLEKAANESSYGGYAVVPAIRTLGRMRVEKAIGPMFGLVCAANDDHINRVVTEALVDIGEANVKPLLSALDHNDRRVQACAEDALGKLGDGRVAGRIAERLGSFSIFHEDTEALGRFISKIRMIGSLGSKDAVPALMKILRDDSAAVAASRAAGEALDLLIEDPEGKRELEELKTKLLPQHCTVKFPFGFRGRNQPVAVQFVDGVGHVTDDSSGGVTWTVTLARDRRSCWWSGRYRDRR